MKNLWKTYLPWLERRRQRQLESWQHKRAKGKARYILWVTIMWGGWMVIATSLASYFFDGSFQIRLSEIIIFSTGGFFLALLTWFDNEINYQNSLKANSDTDSREINQASNYEA
jgi:hypothetical protein